MKTTVIRFLTFDVMNIHPMIYWGLLSIWLLMLIATFLSISQQSIGRASKAVWTIVVLVPLAGLFFYLIFCLTRMDYSFLSFLKRKSMEDLSNDLATKRR